MTSLPELQLRKPAFTGRVRSSRSVRHWFTEAFGRAADIVVDEYNGAPEKTWIYDPRYIRTLLASSGFAITSTFGTHTWSALARRIGASAAIALKCQRLFGRMPLPAQWADIR